MIQKEWKKVSLWVTFNTGQFGIGLSYNKWVLSAIREPRFEFHLWLLFLRVIVTVYK